MSRQSTLPDGWAQLATAYGGVGALAQAMGVSPATLFRLARGQITSSNDIREKVAALSAAKRLPSPLPAPRLDVTVDAIDLRVLELFGETLALHIEPPREFETRLAKSMGADKLIKIAEADTLEIEGQSTSVSASVHLAVSRLLGL